VTRRDRERNPLNYTDAGVDTAAGEKAVELIKEHVRSTFRPEVIGDVGGFGVGSKFSWQALAALNYDFCVRTNVTWSGMLGYKALFVDYSKGSGLTQYEYDMTMHGPIIGVTARF